MTARALLVSALLLAAPAVRAQSALDEGCSDPTEQALEIIRSAVGKNVSEFVDFTAFTHATPLTREAPPEVHAVCRTIRRAATGRPAEFWKLSSFDAGTRYLVVQHVHNPDPVQYPFVSGLTTVGVYDREGRYVEAISF